MFSGISKGTFQGLDANHKVVEVFLKLQSLRAIALAAEEAVPELKPKDEEKVSEDEEAVVSE